jgi:hypothetical protein
MAKLKVFEAATEGFRLIRREPKTVLVWSAAMFVVLGLPALLLMSRLSPLLVRMSQAMETQSVEEIMGVQARLFGLTSFLWILGLFGYALLGAAVLRAVITPEDRRFFYMRLSRAELWMILSAVAGAIIAYIATLVFTMIVGVVTVVPLVILSTAGGDGAANGFNVVLVPLIVVAEIVALYFTLRFAMAPLMSFDQRQFRLFESWTLTRGEGWRLLGLVALLFLACLIIELLLFIPFVIGFAPMLGEAVKDPLVMQQLGARMMGLYGSPWMLPISAVCYLVYGPFMALFIAPFARAYLMLKGDGIAPVAEPAAA